MVACTHPMCPRKGRTKLAAVLVLWMAVTGIAWLMAVYVWGA